MKLPLWAYPAAFAGAFLAARATTRGGGGPIDAAGGAAAGGPVGPRAAGGSAATTGDVNAQGDYGAYEGGGGYGGQFGPFPGIAPASGAPADYGQGGYGAVPLPVTITDPYGAPVSYPSNPLGTGATAPPPQTTCYGVPMPAPLSPTGQWFCNAGKGWEWFDVTAPAAPAAPTAPTVPAPTVPAPAPAPTAVRDNYVAKCTDVRIREQPNLGSPVVATVGIGATAYAVGTVAGANYSSPCGGPGSTWLRITQLNGSKLPLPRYTAANLWKPR